LAARPCDLQKELVTWRFEGHGVFLQRAGIQNDCHSGRDEMRKRVFVVLAVLIAALLLVFLMERPRSIPATTDQSQQVIQQKPHMPETSRHAQPLKDDDTPTPLVRGEPYPAELVHANAYGAPAKIALHVADTKGNSVGGAEVFGAFHGTKNPGEDFKKLTDSDGRLVLESKHAGAKVPFSVKKEGHYGTSQEYWFNRNGWNHVKKGRWIPWNPTVEVTLKEKRNPIPMYAKRLELDLPKGETVGFDCMRGEAVPPHGKGEMADVAFRFSSGIDAPSHNLDDSVITIVPPDEGGCWTFQEGIQPVAVYVRGSRRWVSG
jgi:hypothetical protein